LFLPAGAAVSAQGCTFPSSGPGDAAAIGAALSSTLSIARWTIRSVSGSGVAVSSWKIVIAGRRGQRRLHTGHWWA
jgi:hypothetical protein